MSYLKTAAIALVLACVPASVAIAQESANEIDFGDDSSNWANDGECDDPRFEGPGVAGATLPEDAFADATDCAAAFADGTATLVAGADLTPPPLRVDGIQFGNDTGDWVMDGECDDPRFSGTGMATGTLNAEDAYADRTDCLAAWEAGGLTYNAEWRMPTPVLPTAGEIDAIDFGSDSSGWSNDGECDDPRFEGTGMAMEPQIEDISADASDCRNLFMRGMITMRQK